MSEQEKLAAALRAAAKVSAANARDTADHEKRAWHQGRAAGLLAAARLALAKPVKRRTSRPA